MGQGRVDGRPALRAPGPGMAGTSGRVGGGKIARKPLVDLGGGKPEVSQRVPVRGSRTAATFAARLHGSHRVNRRSWQRDAEPAVDRLDGPDRVGDEFA